MGYIILFPEERVVHHQLPPPAPCIILILPVVRIEYADGREETPRARRRRLADESRVEKFFDDLRNL